VVDVIVSDSFLTLPCAVTPVEGKEVWTAILPLHGHSQNWWYVVQKGNFIIKIPFAEFR